MTLDKDTITRSTNKEFTEFSNDIKSELANKMANHDISVNYSNAHDDINRMKSIFAEINNPID